MEFFNSKKKFLTVKKLENFSAPPLFQSLKTTNAFMPLQVDTPLFNSIKSYFYWSNEKFLEQLYTIFYLVPTSLRHRFGSL